MEAKDPMIAVYGNTMIPHLRSFIVDKIEEESRMSVLEQIYSIVCSSDGSYKERFQQAKKQTEQYCTPELAKELEDEGFMIGKANVHDDSLPDFDRLIEDDAKDGDAPHEWVEKMFPELYA